MKAALWCSLILCALLCVIGVYLVFETSFPLVLRCASGFVSFAAGVAFGFITAEEIRRDQRDRK